MRRSDQENQARLITTRDVFEPTGHVIATNQPPIPTGFAEDGLETWPSVLRP